MTTDRLKIERVAVIGAGVSGVAAAVHLKRAGLDVTVYERSSKAGGIWVYDQRSARDPAYPSTLPSVGDSPEYGKRRQDDNQSRQDSPLRDVSDGSKQEDPNSSDISLEFAPPGPCYIALKNNVSTIEMELASQKWKPGTEEFVPHNVLAEYIQDTAAANGVVDNIAFNTRVNQVQKEGTKWKVEIAKLASDGSITDSTEHFDGVVVASGHYHACNVPDISGLGEWKRLFPGSVRHSKLYRRPEDFKDQNVLLIGAGVSSMDIARDLGNHARSVYQSSRGGPYDVPSILLPENAARVGGIESFSALDTEESTSDGAIPGTVRLRSGSVLCGIHQVIVCTGYHVSFPFLKQYHADGVRAEEANEEVLVTDGQQTHNLHKDIFYIQDPTLAFIGVPYHVATFSLFEFQAMALAAVFAGQVALPDGERMRVEYKARIGEKGAGRTFHSLKGRGDEMAYVKELVEMVNSSAAGMMKGHSEVWVEAYGRRCKRMEGLFSQVRDAAMDERVMQLVVGC